MRKQGNRKRKPGKASRAAKHKRPTTPCSSFDIFSQDCLRDLIVARRSWRSMWAMATTSSSMALTSSSCTDRRTLALSSSNTRSMVKLSATGSSYDNRFISVVTIEGRKIVQWRNYMDSLAAMTALSQAH